MRKLMAQVTQAHVTESGQRASVLGRRTKRRLGTAATYFILVVWAVFSIFPVFWTYLSSIKPSRDVFAIPPVWVFKPTLHNYGLVLNLEAPSVEEVQQSFQVTGQSKLPEHILNTVVVCIGSTALSMLVGSSAAYALARARFRGRRAILIAILLTRLVPPIVMVIPLYLIWRNLRILDTHVGLILAFFTFTLPFVIWMMRGFFLSLPRELEDAALIDGCSRWGALGRVVLPLVAPGVAATALFTALFSWNEFLIAAVIGGEKAKLLTPSIFGYFSDTSILWGRLYAASSVVMMPVVVLTMFIQKHITTGLTAGALKG